MIHDPDSVRGDSESFIVSHIKGEFADLCDGEFFVDDSNIEEIARAVECFIERESGCSFINSGELVMLASRALASIGETPAARRFLLFGSGMVKPSEWEVTAGESMWILDLKQITVRDDLVALEIVFFSALNLLVETIADIWDESSGRGVLGLRHVCSAATSILGSDAHVKKTNFLAEEIISACLDKLEHVGNQRGWNELPHVMNLDF